MSDKSTNNVIFAVAAVSNAYGLNVREFSEMLELLNCIDSQQKSKILISSAAWAAKDIMDNKLKGA